MGSLEAKALVLIIIFGISDNCLLRLAHRLPLAA